LTNRALNLGNKAAKNAVFLLLFVDFENAVDNGYLAAFYFKDDDVADPDRRLSVVGEQEQVAAVEGRLHAAAENDHYGALGACHHHQAFPDHQRRGDDHGKVKHLVVELLRSVEKL